MEVDTGASLSIISEATYADLQSQGKTSPLVDTDIVLRTYTGEEVRPERSIEVTVSYEGREFKLPLLVVKGLALLGRNWLGEIRLVHDQTISTNEPAVRESSSKLSTSV